MNHWIDRRRSGVLLHISSLPGPFAKGVLGDEALRFIDSIVEAGFTVWQFLPLGPTHNHGSPYESLSSAAGNPDFLDMRECVSRGWLSDQSCQATINGKKTIGAIRSEAAEGFWQQVVQDSELSAEIDNFLTSNADWLNDYALFTALKNQYQDIPWWQWSDALRDRSTNALDTAKADNSVFIRRVQFEQYLFSVQWQRIKHYAEQRDVLLFGDIPIYVAHDSSDVWAERKYFTVNEEGLCDHVAGVPPDYFSENGQRWGNPLFHWETMLEDQFDWWIKRIRRQLIRMHLMRIDHFLALESYWAIPGESQDGRVGEWLPAPGEKMLQALQSALGKLPLIAEDLGLITAKVTALRHQFGLPGMKILQFAFGDNASNPYLPHNHETESVAYTGTHDNDTSLGWYNAASDHEKYQIANYLAADCENEMPLPMIRSALASVSRLAIIPAQDLLALPTEARFNTPGTVENNWCWRLDELQPLFDIKDQYQQLNRLYGR